LLVLGKTESVPPILETYLFCCPGLDGKLRFLPKAGGYYDQDFADMLAFKIIEAKATESRKRLSDQEAAKK